MKRKRILCLFSVILLLSMFAAPWACCTPAADPLSILAITATTDSDTSVTIAWVTDRDATSQVLYGTTAGDLDLSTDATTTYTMEHSVALTALTAGVKYYYQVVSVDEDAESATSTEKAFNTTGLAISDVAASFTSNMATVTWTTDDPASSQVEWGTATTYGNTTTLDPTEVTEHSVEIELLDPDTTYHYRVLSETATDSDTSADASFKTGLAVRLRGGMANPPPHLNILIPKGEHLPYRRLMYDTLVNQEKDGSLTPRLATSWDWDEDDQIWTFHLREDVKWHDGESFTADDVKATYDLSVDIAGSYWDAWAKDVVACTIVDDYTIQFEISEPYDWWPVNLREERAEIIPAHIWEDEDMDTWLNMGTPIGTGPFKYAEGDWLTYSLFERNTDYWAGDIKIDEVLLSEYANLEAEILAFKSGDLDYISGKEMRTPAAVAGLLGDPSVETALLSSGRYDMLRINMYRSPNSVKEFRHALSWAIDRKEISEVVYHGYAAPSPQVPFLPATMQDLDIIAWPGGGINSATDAIYTDAERLAEANDILDDLGWLDTNADGVREGPMGEVGAAVTAPLEFTLVTGPNSSHIRAAEIVQENMADIGIKVNLSTLSYGTIFATLKNVAHDWDWYLGGHGQGVNYYVAFAAYFDNPDDLSTAFAAGAVGFDDPTIQGKMVESLTATGAEFDTLVEEIQTLWADFLPYIPVHTTNQVSVYRTDNLIGWDLEEDAGPPPLAIEALFYRNLLKLEKAD